MPAARPVAPALTACLLAASALAASALASAPAFAQTGRMGSSAAQEAGASSTMSAPPPVTGGAPQPSSAATPAQAEAGTEPSAVSGAFTKITPMSGMNIVAELRASGEFTTLLKALDATALTSVVQNQPNITLIAPTDAAFAALPPAELASLMAPANAAKLQALLTYHLINARVSLDKVQNHAAGPVVTVSTKPVTIDGTGATIKINDANVLQAAVPASNGLIYVVDKVLTPPA